MGAIASQVTSLTIVYPTVNSYADQRKHQSSASLAFVRRIHRSPVNSPRKWPVTRKMFPFDDVIMFLKLWPFNILMYGIYSWKMVIHDWKAAAIIWYIGSTSGNVLQICNSLLRISLPFEYTCWFTTTYMRNCWVWNVHYTYQKWSDICIKLHFIQTTISCVVRFK